MNPVSPKTDARPQTLSRNLVVRNRSPKYPIRVMMIPGCGRRSAALAAAMPALNVSVSASSQ